MVTTLRDHLASLVDPSSIRPIPVLIGRDLTQLARRIRDRLGALYVIYGDIRELGDEDFSVYARLVIGPDQSLFHLDPHTKEIIPVRRSWSAWFDRLTPARKVEDVEYPLEFADELEAIIRSVEGEFYSGVGRDDLAVPVLQHSLGIARDSESSGIDRLRVTLGWSMFRLGRRSEAIDLVVGRAEADSASTHLLRNAAGMLSRASDASDPWIDPTFDRETALQQAESILRRAADDRSDPYQDVTLYNLAQVVVRNPDGMDEAVSILERLMASSSHYSQFWYVMRDLAGALWHRYIGARDAGREDEAAAHVARAAHWYSRSIRARRRLEIKRRGPRLYVRRLMVPPILYANAYDAHLVSGHKLRTRYHNWRTRRIREGLLQAGTETLKEGDWGEAYSLFDWACVGRRDHTELYAHVGRSVCLTRLGNADAAQDALDQAAGMNPETTAMLHHLLEATAAEDSHASGRTGDPHQFGSS
ncbi:MAG: hypothetical protein ACRDLB_07020 [Actinomycetota bacterium]